MDRAFGPASLGNVIRLYETAKGLDQVALRRVRRPRLREPFTIDCLTQRPLVHRQYQCHRFEGANDTFALDALGCASATVLHRHKPLCDNGPSYIVGKSTEYIEARKMGHVCGANVPANPRSSAGTTP